MTFQPGAGDLYESGISGTPGAERRHCFDAGGRAMGRGSCTGERACGTQDRSKSLILFDRESRRGPAGMSQRYLREILSLPHLSPGLMPRNITSTTFPKIAPFAS